MPARHAHVHTHHQPRESADAPYGHPPKLIVSDVDGTLLDENELVTPRTRKAISAAVESGAHFVLASGRGVRSLMRVVRQLEVPPMTICANGSITYDSANDVVLKAREFEIAALHRLAEATKRVLPGAEFAVERVDHGTDPLAYVSTPGYIHPWVTSDYNPAPEEELLARPAVKFLVRAIGDSSDSMARILGPEVGDFAEVSFSTPEGLLEIGPPGVSKGSALSELAALFGVEAEDAIAFGDMPNDITMLRWAGRSVAMANAHPLVLETASETTAPHTEEGVAQVLERWFA
ncbi:MAG: HAD family hydrolase [Segniliparus sp.]|uniref:HAD family hydrolase n=1 Tax=Segniliparus sp. TaxID=2804064 RepID=UPI003F3844D0